MIQEKGDKVGLLSILGVMEDNGKDQNGHLCVQIAALRSLQAVSVEKVPTKDKFSPRTEQRIFLSIVDKIESPDWCVRREVAVALRTCSIGLENEVILKQPYPFKCIKDDFARLSRPWRRFFAYWKIL